MTAPAHKFKAGQTVRVVPGPNVGNARGNFKSRAGAADRARDQPVSHQESDTDGHERVVTESQVD